MLVSRLEVIDGVIDAGDASSELMKERQEALNQVEELDTVDKMDTMQKLKCKWAVEGDENSGFFHGSLKRRRKQMAIKGVSVNGDWISDPMEVKNAFFEFF